MNISKWTFRGLVCLGLLHFVSCTKNIDTVATDSINLESADNALAASEFSSCKLRRIVHEHGGVDGILVNGLFTYNAAGNPISLTYGNNNGSGNPNHYFLYDNKNRLREWRQAYSVNDPMESTWHKYGYDENDVLVVDSTFLYAEFSEDGFIGFADTIVSLLTYDAQGRVVKETIRSLKGGTTRYPTYTYDNRGNIGVLGWKSSSYDYKVSIFRSHPVFQFIFRNYSRNNAAPQEKYNSQGLPLSMNPGNDEFFNRNPIIKAIYDCQ